MQREKMTKEMKVVGVVYKYTSPSGKSYIGQTTNERHRRNTWFCTKRRYAGTTINRARAKYGPENFEYEVLFKRIFTSFEEAQVELDKMEIFYINLYDTFKNGYNNTVGGLVPETGLRTKVKGRILAKDFDKVAKRQFRKYRPKHTKEEIQKLRIETNRRNGNYQKIFQFDLDGNFIREFASAGEASENGFGNYMNIKRACKTLGKYKGYNWRFAEDGYVMKVKPSRVYTKEQFVHQYKPVIQYSKTMEYITEYESLTTAANALGISYTSCISACLSGKLPSAHGYKWEYKYKQ